MPSLWDTTGVEESQGGGRNTGHAVGGPGQPSKPVVKVQKMTPADDLEAYLNMFEHTATTVGWAPDQWGSHSNPMPGWACATGGGYFAPG